MKFFIKVLALGVLILALVSCEGKSEDQDGLEVAVFVPGVLEGSPTYEMMARGAQKAADELGASIQIIEGGFNQGDWESMLMGLAAEKRYDLVVTTNPSMPEIIETIGETYPQQDFLCLDGTDLELDNMLSISFNHMEQAFLAGYMGGLITSSEMEGANEDLKIGLLVGQMYPDMERSIKPGFEIGLKTIHSSGEVDFRVLGNWYDAAKAADMARSMFDNGVDVILPIAGSANQGVITAAKEAGKYLLWFDSPGTDLEPGVVLASSLVEQENQTYEAMTGYFNGDLTTGTVIEGGVKAGLVRFDDKDRLYQKYVPKELRDKQSDMIDRLLNGQLSFHPFL